MVGGGDGAGVVLALVVSCLQNCIAFLFVELPWKYQMGQSGRQNVSAIKIKVTKLPMLFLVRSKSMKNS